MTTDEIKALKKGDRISQGDGQDKRVFTVTNNCATYTTVRNRLGETIRLTSASMRPMRREEDHA